MSTFWTWNREHQSDHSGIAIGLGTFLIAATLLIVHAQAKYGLNRQPSINGDELDYDSLGWELSQGRGYQTDQSNVEFRQPYGTLLDDRVSSGPSPTAYRPPLLPLIMAGLNRLFGRQFWAIRVIQILATAVSCGIIAGFATRWGGPLAGVIVVIHYVMVDWRMREFSRSLLTESLSLLWVTLLFMLLWRLVTHPQRRTACIAGAILGLAILTRSMIAFWAPLLCLYVAMRAHEAVPYRRRLLACCFAITAFLVVSPWVLRNLLVMRTFSPLGTQFLMESSAGYSDTAVSRGGMWFNLRDEGFFPPNIDVGSGLEREQNLAAYSSAQALSWIQAHPGALPQLAAKKVLQEIRPWGIGELYLSVLGVVGLIALRRTAAGRTGFCLIACCLLGVAVTWSTGGRFLFPVLSILHLGAAVAAARLLEISICQPVMELSSRSGLD